MIRSVKLSTAVFLPLLPAVLEPKSAELPHRALNPSVPPLPHKAEELHSALLPHNALSSAPCVALPTKPPVPTGTTQLPSANRAALAAILKCPDLAAKKLVFAQQLAKLESDPAVGAVRE